VKGTNTEEFTVFP